MTPWLLAVPVALLIAAIVIHELDAEREYRRFKADVKRIHERWPIR